MSSTRWRSERYLRWVASLPCAKCQREGTTQAHHFKGAGQFGGVGLKAPDYLAMPLCFECHDKLHRKHAPEDVQAQYEWALKTLVQFVDLVIGGLGERAMEQLVAGVAHGDTIGGRRL